MRPGTISQVLEFAATHPVLGREMHRAADEFFSVSEDFEGDTTPTEEDMGFFSEWFVFDYRFPNGENFLERYLHINRAALSPEEIRLYGDLQKNEYGFWEVLDVRLGRGLTLRNAHTAKIYEVKERSATFGLKKGNCFFARVARVENRWELIASKIDIWDMRLLSGARKHLRAMEGNFSSKDAWLLSRGKGQGLKEPKAFMPPELAREELVRVLAHYGLDLYVKADRIEHWLRSPENRKKFVAVSLLAGLLGSEADFQSAMDDLILAVQNLANAMPLKELRGKSPQEKAAEPHAPDLAMNVIPLGGGEWDTEYRKGMELLAAKPQQALRAFQKSFRLLLEGKTTTRDLFRMYANLAVCLFATGAEDSGKRAIDIALELNPKYDFGLSVKEKYERGGYKDIIEYEALRELANAMKSLVRLPGKKRAKRIRARALQREPKNYAELYYEFLRPFEIDFSSARPEPTVVTTRDSSGRSFKLERNDPCPCEARTPDGRPLKWKKCHGKTAA